MIMSVMTSPLRFPAPPDLPTISKVSCGWTHTLAVSAAGRVVAWGCNTYSQLGLEREGEEEEGGRKTAGVCGPREIEVGVFGGEAVRDVAAGLRHSLVVTSEGLSLFFMLHYLNI